MSFLSETDADFSTLHANLEDHIKAEMDETKLRTYEDCFFVTTSHQKIKSRQLNQLLAFLQKNKRKYSDFLQPIVIGNETAPSFSIFLSPGQVRFYCKEATEEAKRRYKMFGYKNPSMYHLEPIGKTCISNRMKEIVKRLNLKD